MLTRLVNLKGGVARACRRLASTHFGFEEVDEQEKQRRVDQVFSKVATRYDLMNDLMSAGIHRVWKNHFVSTLTPSVVNAPVRVLDVAGGTGDIAMRIRQKYGDEATITICDINQEMLEYGQRERSSSEMLVRGDAECLPFPENYFDIYTIAFGIRNCVHIEAVLAEAFRVLRPGGKFACLEFSNMNAFWPLPSLYDWYSMNIIPVMGELVADDFRSYKYLVESIRRFPDQEQFSELIRNEGFRNVRYENLMFGIAAIHCGYKE